MSLFSVLWSILPERRVCLRLLLSAATLLLSSGVSQALTGYGDYKVIGTGADAGISFEFLGVAPPLTSGLVTTFSFINCTVPAGEICGTGSAQVNYSASGGQIRLVTTGASGQSRTWNFPSFLHSGVYMGQTGSGLEPGYVIVSGADATAGQPQSNATNSAFQFPLEVTVNDSEPAYQSGVTVTFTAPGSGPSAVLPDGGLASTDSTGRALITATANSIAGAYPITASATIGGNTFQTSFVAANVNTANATGACQVTTANDDFSAGSLRYQVAACGKGGTITFDPSITTVNLSTGQDIPLTQDITIDGGSGVSINGNGLSRIFFVAGGTITLSNLTLENGTAKGGAGGAGAVGGGGGAAGMGGAIFVNAGSLVINNVTFTNNRAAGGDGGPILSGFFSGGGGGTGGPGGSSASGINGNGGGGGDFGSSGGAGTGGAQNGSGDGAGGGNAGSGAFGGGGSGSVISGAGGFGGGAGGALSTTGLSGTFAGVGGPIPPNGGGQGGAGLGGAIFMRNGTLSLANTIFSGNSATGGMSRSGGSNGQGKGGALYISSTASAVSALALPTLNGNFADSAGIGTACNTVAGSNALDTNDICGILPGPATHFLVSAPATVNSWVVFQVTVTALDANNNVVTGYTGTVHLTCTDPGFSNPTGDMMLTNGQGIFSVAIKLAGTHTFTATDTINSSITGTSNNITVVPGPANHFVVSAPATTSGGTPFPITVTALDLFENVVTYYSGTVHFSSSDSTAGLPADSTLSGGSGTFDVTLKTPGTQSITATDTVNGVGGTSGGITVTIPSIVVTSTADNGTGSLRAALATAATDGSANITFDPTVFATPQTIALTSGTLNIPSNTTITGPAADVTVSGGGSGSNFSVFTVALGVTNASIRGLTIANGYTNSQGGGISNSGALTVTGLSFVNNFAGGYVSSGGNGGGAIYTDSGTLVIANSTFSGNSSAPGGAITIDSGIVTITNSTFSGNAALASKAGGAIFINTSPTVTIANSTFSGNSAAGGGAIFNNSTLIVTNSILSGNSGGDCGANGSSTCPANGTSGNVVGVSNINLAPLGDYVGLTQTMVPLPGSPAICAGVIANIPGGVTLDQRGYPRTTSYGTSPCVDSGAVQTGFSLAFTQQPSDVLQNVAMTPSPQVTLAENGTAFNPAVTVPVTLQGPGTLSGGSVSTSGGAATYSVLKIDTIGTGDRLKATLTLNSDTATTLTATSNAFNVMTSVSQLLFGTAPATPIASGGNAGSAITVKEAASDGSTVTTATDTITLIVSGPEGYSHSYSVAAVNGVAVFNLSAAVLNGVGTYTYTASLGSLQASATQVVNKATATVTLGNLTATYDGSPHPATATTSPTGIAVDFTYNGSPIAPIAAGTYSVVATMNDANYQGTASGTLIIGKATPTITWNAPATITYGTALSAVQLNTIANITGSFVYTPVAGTVLAAGANQQLTASFTPSDTMNYQNATGTTLITVNKQGTAISLVASPTSLSPGQTATFTATVTPAVNGTPTGTVTFLDGGAVLQTVPLSGTTASYSAVLVPGSHSISAAYSGDNNYLASTRSSALNITVLPSDFTFLSTGPNQQTVIPGGTAKFTYTITPTYGTYPNSVTFAVSGLPGVAAYTLSPNNLSANAGQQQIVLTIQLSLSTASNATTRTTDWALALLLLPLARARRFRASSKKLARTLYLLLVASVCIGMSGCGAGNGFLAQASQDYDITITASSGSIVHTSTVNLNVQ